MSDTHPAARAPAPIPELEIPPTQRPPWARTPIYRLQLLGAPVLRERAMHLDGRLLVDYASKKNRGIAEALTAKARERFGL